MPKTKASPTVKRAVSIITYNRCERLGEVIEGVLKTIPNGTDVFVCDDGSTDDTRGIVAKFGEVSYFYGPNRGVGANKTRALFLMKNHHFSVLLEDDLVPIRHKWFELYEGVSSMTDIHHFCRVQDKQVLETRPAFTQYLKDVFSATPVYASSPRGDFTFLTRKVITMVGALNPAFNGVGYAHGEWSARVIKAGLVSHPLGYIDIVEARDKFKQIGDTEGGRWNVEKKVISKQIKRNRLIAKRLSKQDYIYCPLRLE